MAYQYVWINSPAVYGWEKCKISESLLKFAASSTNTLFVTRKILLSIFRVTKSVTNLKMLVILMQWKLFFPLLYIHPIVIVLLVCYSFNDHEAMCPDVYDVTVIPKYSSSIAACSCIPDFDRWVNWDMIPLYCLQRFCYQHITTMLIKSETKTGCPQKNDTVTLSHNFLAGM